MLITKTQKQENNNNNLMLSLYNFPLFVLISKPLNSIAQQYL